MAAQVRFHLSLNVTDIKRSIAFYSVLFAMEPSKCHDDYAKFDVVDPPVVFSLVPHPRTGGQSLSHLGLRVADAAARQAIQMRLETAGIATQCQQGTVCGYARQNKCWVEDPDGNFWEVYEIEAELAPATLRRGIEGPAIRMQPLVHECPVIWEHYVTSALPERIPHKDGTIDEVRLTGTFNATDDAVALRRLLAESMRVLKAGGKVVTHGLMADRPFPGKQPKLPGLAALVSHMPLQTTPLEAFRGAGLVDVQYVKLTETPWFVHDGVEMREVKLVGWKPAPLTGDERAVIYKGPFRRTTDDNGIVYQRGHKVTVSAEVWESLRRSASAEQFLFLQNGEPGKGDSSCNSTSACT
jgi:catechol 2,3-dioxygenase-like lactoylglutathione lyase family enzyme